MGLFDQPLRLVTRQSGDNHRQANGKSKASLVIGANADRRIDAGLAGIDLFLSGNMGKGAVEASRISTSKQLLGIGALSALPTQGAGHGQPQIKLAIVGEGATVPPARCCAMCLVKNSHG